MYFLITKHCKTQSELSDMLNKRSELLQGVLTEFDENCTRFEQLEGSKQKLYSKKKGLNKHPEKMKYKDTVVRLFPVLTICTKRIFL